MKLYSTADVARECGKTMVRVHQVCARLGIGQIVGRGRILSPADLAAIKRYFRDHGHSSKNSRN